MGRFTYYDTRVGGDNDRTRGAYVAQSAADRFNHKFFTCLHMNKFDHSNQIMQ